MNIILMLVIWCCAFALIGYIFYRKGKSDADWSWVKRAYSGAVKLRGRFEPSNDELAALLCAYYDRRIRRAAEAEAERCRVRRAIEKGVLK